MDCREKEGEGGVGDRGLLCAPVYIMRAHMWIFSIGFEYCEAESMNACELLCHTGFRGPRGLQSVIVVDSQQ